MSDAPVDERSPEAQIRETREEMHRQQLRERYRQDGMDVRLLEQHPWGPLDQHPWAPRGYVCTGVSWTTKGIFDPPPSTHVNAQEAFDVAIENSGKGLYTQVSLTNVTGVVSVPPSMIPAAPPLSPPGVNIRDKMRVGRTEKDPYFIRLQEVYAGEYIDKAEYDARLEALMFANTQDELDFLMRDLPPAKKDIPAPMRTPLPGAAICAGGIVVNAFYAAISPVSTVAGLAEFIVAMILVLTFILMLAARLSGKSLDARWMVQ